MSKEPSKRKITLRVDLNGTDVNPYERFGLTQNPFSQLAKWEHDDHCRHLAVLGATPIPNKAYIKKHLIGWTPEFVQICCEQFKKGEYVTFYVTFPESGGKMTKNRFLAAYRAELIRMYPWAADKAKQDRYMESVTNTIANGARTWNANGEAMQKAWHEIGMKGKATLKGLRELPID